MRRVGLLVAALVVAAGCGSTDARGSSSSAAPTAVSSLGGCYGNERSPVGWEENTVWTVSPKGSFTVDALRREAGTSADLMSVTALPGGPPANELGAGAFRIDAKMAEAAAEANQSFDVAFASLRDANLSVVRAVALGDDGSVHVMPFCSQSRSFADVLERGGVVGFRGSPAALVRRFASDGARSETWSSFFQAWFFPNGTVTTPTVVPWQQRPPGARSLLDPDAPHDAVSTAAQVNIRVDVPPAWTTDRNATLCYRTASAYGACTPLAGAQPARDGGSAGGVILAGPAWRGEDVELVVSGFDRDRGQEPLAVLARVPAAAIAAGHVQLEPTAVAAGVPPSAAGSNASALILKGPG